VFILEAQKGILLPIPNESVYERAQYLRFQRFPRAHTGGFPVLRAAISRKQRTISGNWSATNSCRERGLVSVLRIQMKQTQPAMKYAIEIGFIVGTPRKFCTRSLQHRR
jgi:hypothetical protein